MEIAINSADFSTPRRVVADRLNRRQRLALPRVGNCRSLPLARAAMRWMSV
jgi:hypothetical protein